MKNRIAGLMVALFTMLAFSNAKAQCQINNMNSTCSVDVKFTAFNANCTSNCNSAANNNVLPGINTLSPCGGPACPCKLVELVSINGTSIPSVFASTVTGPFSSATPNIPANACGYTVLWYDASNSTFVIQ